MIVDDKIPDIFSKENYEISAQDATKLYNASSFEPFSAEKAVKAASMEYLGQLVKLPAQAQAIYGQYVTSKGKAIKDLGGYVKNISDKIGKVLPEGNVIFDGKTLMEVGDTIQEVGMVNIKTANRNLEELNKRARKVTPTLTDEERESWTYNIAQGGLNYGTMLALSAFNPNLGLGYIGAITAGGETEEGLENYKRLHGGSLEGYEAQAGKDLTLNMANTAVQTILERAFGAPAQLKFFRSAKDYIKAGAGGFMEEFLTENLQNVTDAVFDKMNSRFEGLTDKNGNPLTVWSVVMSQIKGTIVAGMFGGAAGVGFATYNRAQTKQLISDSISNVVPPEDLKKTVDAIYDSANLSTKNIVAKELENSSSLVTKRGEVFENMNNETVKLVKSVKERGGFKDLQTEDDIAAYSRKIAETHADWVLKEATRRNTTIQEVIDTTGIGFDEETGLILPMTKGVTSEESTLYQEAKKKQFEIIQETNPHDDSLGKHTWIRSEDDIKTAQEVWGEGENITPDFTKEMAQQALNDGKVTVYSSKPIENGVFVTPSKMEAQNYAGGGEVYSKTVPLSDVAWIDGVEGQYAELPKETKLMQESQDIANENARLDDLYPAYEGETININGKERTVYNSNGDRIAKSKEALENFYRWFGDSKVVDGQGRPLVVYHGSPAKNIEVFDKTKIGLRDYGYFGRGFYFTPNKDMAEFYYTDNYDGADYDSGKVYPVYINLKKPKYVRSIEEGNIDTEKLKKQGYDGVVVYSFNEYSESVRETDEAVKQEIEEAKKYKNKWWQLKNYFDEVVGKKIIDEIVAFEPNQIKSTSNRGTYSESDNIYKQGEKGSIKFEGDKALITLTERADSTTLPHELAHYYLQNTFLYTKSGLASPEYMENFKQIAKYLGITEDQETIKEWQQEKFARAYEMYQMGKAPEGMEIPLTKYQEWLRSAYGKMQQPMYRDENGELKVPEFDYDTMKMFASLAGETLTEPQFKETQERVRGLAKTTSEMAKQKGIETETPMYEPRSSTEMGKKADEFIKENKQLAIDIVKGLAPEQEGLFRQDLFAALRELALNEGDSDLLNELSRSMTVEEATELGQRIQALARGTVDPVKQMTELRDERMKKNKVTKKEIKEETKKATKEIKKEIALAAQPKEWQDFIKSLEC